MGRYLKFDEKLQKIPEKVHSKKDRIEIILGVSLLVVCGFSYFVLDAFGEERFSLDCPKNSYHGLDNQGNAACRDIQTNQILEPVSVTIVDSNSDETKLNSRINIVQETGWLQDILTSNFGQGGSFLIWLTLFVFLVIGLFVIILRKFRRRTSKSKNNETHVQSDTSQDTEIDHSAISSSGISHTPKDTSSQVKVDHSAISSSGMNRTSPDTSPRTKDDRTDVSPSGMNRTLGKASSRTKIDRTDISSSKISHRSQKTSSHARGNRTDVSSSRMNRTPGNASSSARGNNPPVSSSKMNHTSRKASSSARKADKLLEEDYFDIEENPKYDVSKSKPKSLDESGKIIDTSAGILMPDSNVLLSALGVDYEKNLPLAEYLKGNILRVVIPDLIWDETDSVLEGKGTESQKSEFRTMYRHSTRLKQNSKHLANVEGIHKKTIKEPSSAMVKPIEWICSKQKDLKKKFKDMDTEAIKRNEISDDDVSKFVEYLYGKADTDRAMVVHALMLALAEKKSVFLLTSDFDIYGFKEEFENLGDITIIKPKHVDLSKYENMYRTS